MDQINIAIVDRRLLTRESLEHLLSRAPFNIVSLSRTLREALSNPRHQIRPTLVLFGSDTETEIVEQVDEILSLSYALPQVRWAALTDVVDASVLHAAISAGVAAVVSKDVSAEILRRSLELVALGQHLYPAALVAARPHEPSSTINVPMILPAPVEIEPSQQDTDQPNAHRERSLAGPQQADNISFSEREAQILRRLVLGSSNKAVARELNITEATVKVHVKGLMRKIRASNRTQAAIWAIQKREFARCCDWPCEFRNDH